MTVGRLIELLGKYDKDTLIVYKNFTGNYDVFDEYGITQLDYVIDDNKLLIS